MANIVVTRNYLQNVIGLTDAAQANAVIDEGITNLEDLADFEEDDIKTLCSSVRRPGGMILLGGNPVANPGHNIPAICETRLILAAYAAKIYRSVMRPIDPVSMNAARLREFKKHREVIDNFDDGNVEVPEVSRNYGIMKALENFPMILRATLGTSKVPLSYVIRPNANPGPPPVLRPNVPWSIESSSLEEELIKFTPHTGPAFQADSATVFRMLQEMLHETSHVSSLKPYLTARNGRGALSALQLHNMGQAKWDKLIEAAEHLVCNRTWNGKNARFPLKLHITKHREAHNDMVRASQHVQYAIPNEHTRVNRLLKSITSSDPNIAAAKTTILNDAVKKDDFEEAADFLMLTAPQKSQGGNPHNISAIEQAKRKRGGGQTQVGKTGVEFRYYKKSEFAKLSKEQKDELREWRAAQKDTKKPKTNKQQIAALKQELEKQAEVSKAQAQTIAALQSAVPAPALAAPPTPAPAPAPGAGGSRNPLQPPPTFNQRGGNGGN